MQSDVEGLVGASHGERGGSRENWRNGYRDREWQLSRLDCMRSRLPDVRLFTAMSAPGGSRGLQRVDSTYSRVAIG
jgi:hypothetical protein